MNVLSCQARVTVTSFFIYTVYFGTGTLANSEIPIQQQMKCRYTSLHCLIGQNSIQGQKYTI